MMQEFKKGGLIVLSTVLLFLAAGRLDSQPKPLFNATDVTNALDFINSRPVPSNAYRVLFVGDSLTLHEPSPGLWDHFQGMAATTPEHDFVDLAIAHMQARIETRPVEAFYNNGGKGKIGPMLQYLKDRPALKPDMVVLQGGENDPFDATFQVTYRALLQFFDRSQVRIVVLGDWNSKEKSGFEQREAERSGIPFISLLDVHHNPSYSGDGGPYGVEGVAMHPNDNGMNAIADAIDREFDKLVPASQSAGFLSQH